MNTKEIELTTAEVVNIVSFFNQEIENQKENDAAFFNSLPNLLLWKFRRNIKALLPTFQEFETVRENLQLELQEKWFVEEYTEPIEDDENDVVRIKDEYLGEYQQAVNEANLKLNEILMDKAAYTIQTMNVNAEIEDHINDIDSKDFDKIEMLMFMDEE